ncbi:hypothetical protein BVRB_2g034000 [Beta vulgaris subsp. vulgaris]|nr:hypothetical protein BVRB_2g034000 [Beta vulgaris subsp. vulgaris]
MMSNRNRRLLTLESTEILVGVQRRRQRGMVLFSTHFEEREIAAFESARVPTKEKI